MGIDSDKCISAWDNCLRQLNIKADILFLGDSIIYYGNFNILFPNKVVCNLMIRGDTINGLNKRIIS